MHKKIYFIILLLILSSVSAFSQEVKIREVRLHGENIEIRYDLIDDRTDRSYSIQLYTSTDNFIQPMQLVEGDAGIDIPVGQNKLLVWKAKEELGVIEASMALELKGNIYIPFIDLQGLEDGMVFKRSKPFDLIWSGGRGDNVLNFELYQGDNVIASFEERPNVGNTTMQIPGNIKPGDNYRFRISDSRNKDEIVFSNSFSVRRKIPLGVKIGAAFFIGAVTGYLINELKVTPEPNIELPPLPPDKQ